MLRESIGAKSPNESVVMLGQETRCCGSCQHRSEMGQADLARNGEANMILSHMNFSVDSYLGIFSALAEV